MSKGLSLQDFGSLAIGFVTVAIVLAISGSILTSMYQSQCETYNATSGRCVAETTATNATYAGVTGLQTMGTWLPIIAVVLAAVVVISVVRFLG